MSETGNIEDLAKIVAKDIFSWFKWQQAGLKDVNWDCVQDHHKKKTHPSDTVFSYIHPYTGDRIFLNTDLKSYAEGTIKPAAIRKAIQSLAMSVECANVSQDWQDKYITDDGVPHKK